MLVFEWWFPECVWFMSPDVRSTWNGITRLTVSPTFLTRVWRRFLGSQILGRSVKEKAQNKTEKRMWDVFIMSHLSQDVGRESPNVSNLETLTHYLSDGHGLSQFGGSTGSCHVVGSHTELQLVSSGEISYDQRCPVSQALSGWYPFIRWDQKAHN